MLPDGPDSTTVPPSPRPAAPTQGAFAGLPQPAYAASPSRLLAHLDCPRRYRFQYLDRPQPAKRPQRAHTSMGNAVHNALRDWWEQGERTPEVGASLVARSWIDVGFRDAEQSAVWRARSAEAVAAYLRGVDPQASPLGIERPVAFLTEGLRMSGRIDRLDDREGELVVVDYKTSRRPSTEEEARTSLPLALYAAGVWKMFRRRCLTVELHHIPSGTIARHVHTPESLTRKVGEARSLARDLQRADADFAKRGADSPHFPVATGPMCGWCDFRAHCPEGQLAAPEKSDWAALDDPTTPPSAEVE